MSDCTNCGEYCGHSHGQDERVILTDLIADLRALHRLDSEVSEDEVLR